MVKVIDQGCPSMQPDGSRSVLDILGDFFRLDLTSHTATPELSKKLRERVMTVTEATKLQRKLTGYGSEMIDLGTVAWFRVYVVNTPAERNHAVAQVAELPADYISNTGSGIKTAKPTPKVKAAIMAASSALQAFGFQRQRSDLIFASLKSMTNQLTGGSTGGYADKSNHGIVLDIDSLDHIKEFLAHEWAHMYWFQLPKASKTAFARFFENHVLKAGTAALQKSEPNYFDKPALINDLWRVFAKEFSRERGGMRPDDYFEFKRKHATVNTNDPDTVKKVSKEICARYYIGLQGTVLGRITTAFRDANDVVIKKGAKVYLDNMSPTKPYIIHICLSSWTEKDLPNGGLIRPKTPAHPDLPDSWLLDDALALVDVDVSATQKSAANVGKRDETKNIKPGYYGPDNTPAPASFGQVTNTFYVAAEAAAKKVNDYVDKYLGSKALGIAYAGSAPQFAQKAGRSIFTDMHDFADAYCKAARDAGAAFDPEKTFKTLCLKYADLDLHWGSVETLLAKPEGNAIKEFMAAKGITPTSYAASNVKELWAETVTYCVLNAAKVSKELRKAVVNIVTGKS